MPIANFWLRNALWKATSAGFALLDAGRLHPSRERNLRALRSTVDYIERHLPGALAIDTQWELLRYALSQTTAQGAHLEFGVFGGGSIRYLAKTRRDATFHGFDSFEGLPESWTGAFARGAFSRGGRLPRVPRNVVLHKGLFGDTLPEWRTAYADPIAFVHVDCDLYSSTVEVLAGIGDRLQAGTIVVFDEYFNHAGWERHEFRAWQEFVAGRGVRYDYLAYAREQVAIRITHVAPLDRAT